MTYTPRPLDDKIYGRIMRFFGKLVVRFGLTIRLHGDEKLLEEGDIFLFNHFTRLETLLPPLIWYQKRKILSHSVAHAELFEIHPRLTRLFEDTGTLPTNMPGLMPYLAAQILRGRKMMIYPEGGMIRDKKVRLTNGDFGVLKEDTGDVRKLHRGAAALAEMLNLFKARLVQLEGAKDKARLERWREALGFETVEDLLAAAKKPTVLVPATLTFYPLRNAPNILLKLAKRFMKVVSPALEDELVTEGNLILRATDLDIQMNPPIVLKARYSKMEKWILDQTFRSKVSSLEELFALKDTAEGWSEKLLANMVAKRTDKLRDAYESSIYRGLHLNMGHLFATLLIRRAVVGDEEIDRTVLNRALYYAVMRVQGKKGIHLHSTLTDPKRYVCLREGGNNRHVSRLLDISLQAKLVEINGEKIHFLPAMHKMPKGREARLKHPLRVMANEAEIMDGLGVLMDRAWEDAVDGAEIDVGTLWRDEMNGFNAARAEAEACLISEDNGKPTFLRQPKKGGAGILMIHGFLASPGQLSHLGQSLFAAGNTVMGARIPGHGTHVDDLKDAEPEAWGSDIRRQYDLLARVCDRVVILGFSTGGMLALRVAATRPEKLAGLIVVGAPYTINERFISLVPLAHRINRLVAKVWGGDGIYPMINYPTDDETRHYNMAPTSATAGLLAHIQAMHGELADVQAPTLVLHADRDPLCAPASAKIIHRGLTGAEATLLFVNSDQHNIISHPTAEVLALVQGFLKACGDKEDIRYGKKLPRLRCRM
ncbi:MAG: hypothetical protein COY40_04395 [Alphaproteobacteria bacterium CG_4_10_14_0_8_um_filter_53_9]|nr:MAG: hypothetical protein COY40_04395 [Alphaproteobacteria bacterium CG_4_10_14_0_8_um_filter_53_9]